jgi:hypothetical protein
VLVYNAVGSHENVQQVLREIYYTGNSSYCAMSGTRSLDLVVRRSFLHLLVGTPSSTVRIVDGGCILLGLAHELLHVCASEE